MSITNKIIPVFILAFALSGCSKVSNPSNVVYVPLKQETSVVKVIDGDTVELKVNWLPHELGTKLLLRIHGVDTPEKGHRAKCVSESYRGESATKFSQMKLASASSVEVKFKEWDKYGGRVLGDLILDGKSLSAELISSGNARPYHGEKKSNWCSK